MPVSLVDFQESRAQLACGSTTALGVWSLLHSDLAGDLPHLSAAFDALPGNDVLTPTAALFATSFVLGVILEVVWVQTGRQRLKVKRFRATNDRLLEEALNRWREKGTGIPEPNATDLLRQNATRLELGLITDQESGANLRVYDDLRRLRAHANLLDALSVGIVCGIVPAAIAEWGYGWRIAPTIAVAIVVAGVLWWRAENSWMLWWRNLTYATESRPQALDDILRRGMRVAAGVEDANQNVLPTSAETKGKGPVETGVFWPRDWTAYPGSEERSTLPSRWESLLNAKPQR